MGYGTTASGSDKSTFLVGMFGDVFALLYYSAPLSTAYNVILTKDSSSLYVPMILLNTGNAFLWFFYGLLGDDNNIVIWFPNLVGIILSFMQLSLVFLYKNRNREKAPHFEPKMDGSLGGYTVPSSEVTNPIIHVASLNDVTEVAATEDEADSSISNMEMESMEIVGMHKQSGSMSC